MFWNRVPALEKILRAFKINKKEKQSWLKKIYIDRSYNFYTVIIN